MGKKREREESTAGGDGSPRKRHKKNKHKRHKLRDEEERGTSGGVDVGVVEGVGTSPGARPLTLKIKLGNKLLSSNTTSDLPDDMSSPAESGSMLASSLAESESLRAASSMGGGEEEWGAGSDVSVGKEGEVDAEEEAWLDALETGEVDERGYLPQKRTVSSLTARQRAMLGSGEGELLELPIGKVSKELTEEMVLKKTEKNRKRRLQAQKRKEKRKAETVRKLLEKQSTKKKDEERPKRHSKPTLPHIRYTSSSEGISLSFPSGMDLPLKPQQAPLPPPPQTCAIEGCRNPRKYSDSLSKLPLCSLECYRKLRTSDSQAPVAGFRTDKQSILTT